MQEVWKDIIGYEGLYQVSNTGKVKSNKKILKPILTDRGYIVNLYKNKKMKHITVANLVANHFLNKNDENSIVLHIGNIEDDRVENLKFGTRKEGAFLQYKNKRRKGSWSNYDLNYTDYMKLLDDAKNNGVNKNTLNKRLQKGWTLEESVEIPVARQVRKLADIKIFKYNGRLMSVRQIANTYDLNVSCIYKRLKRGWGVDEIIEIPPAIVRR